ncbi:MAG: YjfB family protein [Oscillospiraceae bacterium]
MDLSTSVAQLSMSMSSAKFQQQLGTSVMKKAMDINSQLALGTLEMLDKASPAAFSGDVGAIFDVRA